MGIDLGRPEWARLYAKAMEEGIAAGRNLEREDARRKFLSPQPPQPPPITVTDKILSCLLRIEEQLKMALKPRPKLKGKGKDIGDHYVFEDGKLKPNPDKEKKIPVPARYARRNKKKWKPAR